MKREPIVVLSSGVMSTNIRGEILVLLMFRRDYCGFLELSSNAPMKLPIKGSSSGIHIILLLGP